MFHDKFSARRFSHYNIKDRHITVCLMNFSRVPLNNTYTGEGMENVGAKPVTANYPCDISMTADVSQLILFRREKLYREIFRRVRKFPARWPVAEK